MISREDERDALIRSYITLLGVVRVMVESKNRIDMLRLGGVGLRDSINDIKPIFRSNPELLKALEECDEQMAKVLRGLGEQVN